MNKGFLLRYVLSFALGAVLVWLAFRGEDWSDFGTRLKSVRVDLVVGYLALFAGAHFVRMIRWGVLVRALGPIGWRSILSAGAIGYMCIIVFPLRLGEFVRPYLVRGEAGVTASGALATVVVERVIDGLLLVGLFFTFISILPDSGDPRVEVVKLSAWVAGAIFLGTLVVLAAAYWRRQATLDLLSAIGRRIHAGITERALGLLDAFLDGLKVLPDRRRLGGFLLLTFGYWALLGVGMKLMAHATHIPDMSWTGAFALLAVITVGIMVPAGPGFTGTFEVAAKAGFTLLVLSPESLENVALYTLMLHAAQLLVQVAWGAVFLFTGQVRFGQLVAAQETEGQA